MPTSLRMGTALVGWPDGRAVGGGLVLRVGLSGGIGSGKSTVARRLVEHGVLLIDSDVLAREAVALGSEGLRLIRDRFGDSVIDPDGELDRPALGRVVFDDDAARADLNAIVHPRVLAATRQEMAKAPDDAVVVHDIPLLVELGREVDYHLVLIVGASEAVRLRRLVDLRGMAESDARARIAAQATDEQRRAAADVWLANESDVESLVERIDVLWRERLVPFAANLRRRTPARRSPPVLPQEGWEPASSRLLGRLRKQLSDAGLADRVVAYGQRDPDPASDDPAAGGLTIEVDDHDLARHPAFESALLAAGFVGAPGAGAAGPDRAAEVIFGSADPGRPVVLAVRTETVSDGSSPTPVPR